MDNTFVVVSKLLEAAKRDKQPMVFEWPYLTIGAFKYNYEYGFDPECLLQILIEYEKFKARGDKWEWST